MRQRWRIEVVRGEEDADRRGSAYNWRDEGVVWEAGVSGERAGAGPKRRGAPHSE